MKLISVTDIHDYTLWDAIVKEYNLREYNTSNLAVEDNMVDTIVSRLKKDGLHPRVSRYSTSDIIGAVATYNADPFCVETDEQALPIIEDTMMLSLTELNKSDEEDWQDAVDKLDLEGHNPRHIYQMPGTLICFSKDFD